MSFTEALHRLRTESGLSQVKLSRRVGIDVSYLNRIEKGNRHPPARSKVLAIAIALGLSREEADDLLNEANYTGTSSQEYSPGTTVLQLEQISPEAEELGVEFTQVLSAGLTDSDTPPEKKFLLINYCQGFISGLRLLIGPNK